MNLDITQIVLFVISFVMACIGWWLRMLWDMVAKLREEHAQLRAELPREYVPTSRMDMIFDKLDTKLDRLMDKLDMKADKP